MVDRIKDVAGIWREEPGEIREVIASYFSDLFTAAVNDGKLSENEVVQRVTEADNISLVAPITREEVHTTVFAMHPDKAPGIDGMNPPFYQAFWSIVEQDVVKFCGDFMKNETLPDGINETPVCSILKMKKPHTMADLRPISLCNVLVRILSKFMTNRLKPCLNGIISDKQSAFTEGRLLTDNALLAFEINHYIKRRT